MVQISLELFMQNYNLVEWPLNYVWLWLHSLALILTLICYSPPRVLLGVVTYHTNLLIQLFLLGSQPLLLPYIFILISELGKTLLLKHRVMTLLFCCGPFSQHSEFYYLMLTAANVAINLLSQKFFSKPELCKSLNESTWSNMLSLPPSAEKTCL